MQIINNLDQATNNAKAYNTWKKREDDREAQREVLYKTVNIPQDQLEIAKSKGYAITNAINVMEEEAEDKSCDIETAIRAAYITSVAGLSLAGIIKKRPIAAGPLLAISLAYISLSNFVIKKVGKISRFNAREEKLKDPRNFAVYTPEQLKKAREIAKTMFPDKESEKSNFKNIYDTLLSLKQDNKRLAYSREEAKAKEKERKKYTSQIVLTPQESEKINADKTIIAHAVKSTTLISEKYTKNIENAARVLQNLSFIPSAFMAIGAYEITNKLLKQGKLNFRGKVNPAVVKDVTALLVGAILPICTSIYANKLTKVAGSIGRLKAQQELTTNPRNFYYYEEKNFESVKNIKSNKKKSNFFSSTLAGLKYIFKNFRKDQKNYRDYISAKGIEDEKFRKALKQIALTPQQIKEALLLQKKVFKTFDKMDEKAEVYSENTITLTELLEPIVPFISAATIIASGIVLKHTNYLGNLALKKLKTHTPDNKIGTPLKNTARFFSKTNNEFKNLVVELSPEKKAPKTLKEYQEFLEKADFPQAVHKILKDKDKSNLRKTILISAPLILCSYSVISFSLQTFIDRIHKKAEHFGLMKAMKDLDDPKYFIDPDDCQKELVKKETEKFNENTFIINNKPKENSSFGLYKDFEI